MLTVSRGFASFHYPNEPFLLHSCCTVSFERFHCHRGVLRNHLHVNVHRGRDIRVPQDLLDDLVGDSQPVEVRGQPASKSMPPMPRQLCSFECGPDHVLRQGVQVQGLPLQALKNVPPMRIPRTRSVPFEKKPQLCNDRNGSFALLSLRFIYMASPYCLLYPDGKAVVVFPKETADFTLASARECRYCDCGSGFK